MKEEEERATDGSDQANATFSMVEQIKDLSNKKRCVWAWRGWLACGRCCICVVHGRLSVRTHS